MKRDMDIIRDLLLSIEAKNSFSGIWDEDYKLAEYDSDVINVHMVLLAEAELIRCETAKSSSNPNRIIRVMVFDLTWKGHEFLDTIRDPKIWTATKAKGRQAGNLSLEFAKEIAIAIAKGALVKAGISIS